MRSETVTFRKTGTGNAQFVYHGDKMIGSVRRVEDWTVYGQRVRWEAHRKSRIIGSSPTRKAAAELLIELEAARDTAIARASIAKATT